MNIIIPIGGIGKRFVEDGYKLPKPLIRANGKQVIFHVLDSLNIVSTDNILIPYRKEFDRYNFQSLLLRRYPKFKFIFSSFDYDTKGASETVLIALNKIRESELDNTTIVIDSDSFFNDDIITKARELGENAIFYFDDTDVNPIYSYIKIENETIVDIAEKKKISNNACSGAYCFKSGKLLKNTIETVILDETNKQNGEFYISGLYKFMLKNHCLIVPIKINGFNCLGTPNQLKSYSSNLNNSKEKLRICFDLDNTLVSYPVTKDDYTSVEPIKENIKKLKYFKKLGHHIIIYTARRMKTHSGNVGAIIADIGKITLDTLEKFKIPYDEIFFGKPFADFYIDDLAVNCFDDIEKEIGLYDIHPETRSHNQIKIEGETVIKFSNSIEGEKYWYLNIPENIKDLFPKLINYTNESVTISKIVGLPISYLNVNKVLTRNTLLSILNTLKKIHNSEKKSLDINIYANYADKLNERVSNYDFSKFNGIKSVVSELNDFFLNYAEEKRGIYGVIHGDSVFTNILIDNYENLKFIDMRGKVGNDLSIYGDVFYDYAKIYQSIIGYDCILLEKEINYDYININKKIFFDFINENFGEYYIYAIKQITKSLIISLIPIHDNNKTQEYYKLIKNI